jgi:translation initiation factor IF-1
MFIRSPSLLQSLTNNAIVDARQHGSTRVRLDVRPDDRLTVQEVTLAKRRG